MTEPPETDAPLFEAFITPHRSLGPRGFLLVMATLAVISFGAGLGFFLIGAWPVIGFMGLDVLLVWVAFRMNYRHARQYERLHLTRETLLVERLNYYGKRRSWTFQPAWLRVELERAPEEEFAQESHLYLASHGQRFAIGAFLASEEKAELAAALDAALARSRQAPGLAPGLA